jgi:hypothetical protein
MKKYLLPLVVMVIMVAGCKLDEAGFPKPGDNLILGKWYNKSTTTYTPPQNGNTVVVNINDNYTSSDYISFATNTVTFSMTGIGTNTFKYALAGSTLTLTSNDTPPEIETQTILKLTTDSLVLTSNGTVDAGGTITTFTVTDRYARK